MKKKIYRYINIFLAIIMLISHSSIVLASINKEKMIAKKYQQSIVEEATYEKSSDINSPMILNELNAVEISKEDTEGKMIYEGSADGEITLSENPSSDLPSKQYKLSEEDLSLIHKFKSISIESCSLDNRPSLETGSKSILPKPALNITKRNGEGDYTNLRGNFLYGNDYIELVLKSLNNEPINGINFYLNENVDIIKELFTDEQKYKIKEILEEIDSYRQQSEYGKGFYDLDTYKEILRLLDQLKKIKPYYSMEDQGLTVKKYGKSYLRIANAKPYANELKFIVKANDKELLNGDELLKLAVNNDSKKDQFSVVYKKDQMKSKLFAPLPLRNTRAIKTTEIISADDIAPRNYLNLLENMPGAKAEIIGRGTGVDGLINNGYVTIPADAGIDDKGGMWAGNWDIASTKLSAKLAGDAAIAVRFEESKVKNGYSQDMDIGWYDKDLKLDTTTMWVKVKYTNAAYYRNEIVDAEATIKITPMKNRSPKLQDSATYGSVKYYPMIQLSHNLYKGWAWQNVKEINVDLVFKKKNGETIQFESSTFGGDNATYFTINSLNESKKLGHNSLGPEYVRPDESTITGAYVIPGSNIQTSYDGGGRFGVQYAYNGGTTKWDGDDPSNPNWSQNSVLFTTANTDHLNFTMGNLMKEPDQGEVPKTDFVWMSMSTQSFANGYVEYKDIEVNKRWIDSGENHGPITVNLLKNYEVVISYLNSTGQREKRTIEVENLLADTVTISSETDWKYGFYRIPDELSQYKLIKKLYKNNKDQLRTDAGSNFPGDVPPDFQIEDVTFFSYTISESPVPGYISEITGDSGENGSNGFYTITNTKNDSYNKALNYNKKIDYLNDDDQNGDTSLKGEDFYRQYLDIDGGDNEKGIDFLFVVDTTSSMLADDMNGRQRDEVADEIINGAVGRATADGLLTKVLSLSNKNNAALITFVGRGKAKYYSPYDDQARIIMDWTNIGNKTVADYASVLYDGGTGTNYCAGLLHAIEMFKSNSIRDNGNRKVMIFISDGSPNDAAQWDRKKQQYRYTSKNINNNTMDILDVFLNETKDYTPQDQEYIDVHTIAVRLDENKKKLLKNMAEVGGGQMYSGDDFASLTAGLEEIISRYFPNNIEIEDTLSQYVNLNTDKVDFKLKMINLANNAETTIWSGQLNQGGSIGNAVNNGASIIESVTFNNEITDSSNGKVALKFKPGYSIGSYRFEMSYNLKVSEKAKKYLSENNNKYPRKGDKDTDYGSNRTSSAKKGFYSNEKATVKYVQDGVEKNGTYKHPVVQTSSTTGLELPTTGGRGTKAIKIIGLIVILGSTHFLFRKKKNIES